MKNVTMEEEEEMKLSQSYKDAPGDGPGPGLLPTDIRSRLLRKSFIAEIESGQDDYLVQTPRASPNGYRQIDSFSDISADGLDANSPYPSSDQHETESDESFVPGTLEHSQEREQYEPLLEDEEADDTMAVLKRYRKHYFIFSDAGKPIYSRYGSEEDLSPLMGVMQALCSIAVDWNDSLQVLHSPPVKVVFIHREPLILAAVSRNHEEPHSYLKLQLNYLYDQYRPVVTVLQLELRWILADLADCGLRFADCGEIISVLTGLTLKRLFDHRRNYDLRRALSGTETTCANLLDYLDSNHSPMLAAVECLPLPLSTRDSVGQAFVQSVAKLKLNLVFIILCHRSQLVAMARLKKYAMHPSDLHIVLNLVESVPCMQESKNWVPVCLPKFDSSGFLHAHISVISDEVPLYLLLLTTDRNLFSELDVVHGKILERLKKGKLFQQVVDACKKPTYRLADLNLPGDMWHCIYKTRNSSEITSPVLGSPYLDPKERRRLFIRIVRLHSRMKSDTASSRIIYTSTDKESLLGWHTSSFELYVVFSPLVTKHSAISHVDKLMKWLKKEEEKLFILNPALF